MTVSNILACLSQVDSGLIDFAVVKDLSDPEVSDPSDSDKQALVFLKPELLSQEQPRPAVVSAVVAVLERDGLTIHGAAVLGPRRLARIIPLHYGVINRVSRLGTEALSPTAATALEERFGADLRAGVPALGGHQIIRSGGSSAQRLAERISNQPPTKLGPGTYATKLAAADGDEAVIALNGFHPEQLEHYTAPGARVVALEVRWSNPAWSAFRSDVVGATNPATAKDTSIRGILRTDRERLSIGDVSISRNGVHGSAGPFEAMIELSRFFGVPASNTDFGRRLLRSDRASTLTAYESVDDAVAQRLFDATEDAEPGTAVKILEDRS